MRGFFHADQRLRNMTQNSFCTALSRRRGLLACSASNCFGERGFPERDPDGNRKHWPCNRENTEGI